MSGITETLQIVQFIRYLNSGVVIKSGWGLWTQSEIDSIAQIHQRAGWDVVVESEWPEVILEDLLDAEVVI